ncbi:MAG: type 4a pilus biogenesis protein PilO [Gammaproteobacteria bacterium]|jgi:type IV pilus assembly protein PilO|nr:type 4a pilus biogenesis protein PilO [Gammaproteobacteria bacterium]
MDFESLKTLDINDVASWPNPVKILLALTVCAFILAGGYFFIVKDQLDQLQRAQVKEQELRGSFARKKALAVNLPAYRAQMKEMQESFGVMLRQLPNKTEIPELLIDITQAGIGRGLQFELFKPAPKQTRDFYAALPIQIKVRGTYHELGQFISDVAAMPRIVTMGDLTISGGRKSDRLSMAATAMTYHYLDPDEVEALQANRRQAKRTRR